MEKTMEELQRIKDAVLQELNSICKDCDLAEVSPRLWVKKHDSWPYDHYWFDCYRFDSDGEERRIFKATSVLPADDPYWAVAYSVLGLQARAQGKSMYDALNIAQAEIRSLYPRLGYIEGGSTLYAIDNAMKEYENQ